MLKKIAAFIVILSVTLLAQSRGTPSQIRVNVDANGYVVTSSAVQTLPITSTVFSNARIATDASGNLLTTAGGSSQFLPIVIGGSTASSTLTLQSTTGVGTTDAIIFKVGNNGATQAFKLYTNGFSSFGTSCVVSGCEAEPAFNIHATGETNAAFVLDRFSANASGYQQIFRKARGTAAAPTKTLQNDAIVQILSRGWEEVTPGWSGNLGSMNVLATEDFTNAAQGTKIQFNVVKATTTTPFSILQLRAGGAQFGGAATGLAVANVGANSCGTTAATIAGNQTVGEVTVGATSGTQCRVTVPEAIATRFNGSCSNQTTANLCRVIAVSTSTFDLVGTFAAGDVLAYSVFAR